MKFLAPTVAFLATATAAAPANSKNALLKKAVRLAKEGRALEEQQFQITGDYSIKFDHCVSFTVDNDEMKNADEYGNNLMTYIQQGSMVAQKSFVTFNVCQTNMCGYEKNDDQYIIEAGQYVAITSTVDIKNHERYCEGCREAQDYCLYGNQQYADGQQQDADGQQQYAEDGERRLANNNGVSNMEVVDCGTCESMKCFEENQNNNQYQQYSIQEEDIDEWIQETAECVETGYLWQNMPLYAGFMCNDNGSGVELALFMDDECSIYNSMVSFSEMIQSNGGQNNNGVALLDIAIASRDFVQGAFTKVLSCADTEYVSPEQAYQAQQNQQNNNNNGDEWYKQAGETCQDLMQGLPLATCGYGYGEYREYKEQQQADEYDAYSWYQPQLTADDAEDLQGVCSILQGYNGNYADLHNYKKSESGSFYVYKSESGANAGKVFGWMLLVACVAGATAFVVTKKQQQKRASDPRRDPLV